MAFNRAWNFDHGFHLATSASAPGIAGSRQIYRSMELRTRRKSVGAVVMFHQRRLGAVATKEPRVSAFENLITGVDKRLAEVEVLQN